MLAGLTLRIVMLRISPFTTGNGAIHVNHAGLGRPYCCTLNLYEDIASGI